METVSTAISTANGTKEYSLPTGYLQMKEFHLTTDPLQPLSYVTPEMMTRLWAGSSKGKPQVYTILGDNVSLGPTPDAVYTTSMLYYKAFDALSDSTTTNWVISNVPHLYLYGSLLQAEPFLMNDERVPLWERAVRQAIADLQSQDDRDRHSGSEMRVLNTGRYP